eukprot:14884985-Alexandrium_andersonii.AAC.1
MYIDTLAGLRTFEKPSAMGAQSAGSLDPGLMYPRALALDGPSRRPVLAEALRDLELVTDPLDG